MSVGKRVEQFRNRLRYMTLFGEKMYRPAVKITKCLRCKVTFTRDVFCFRVCPACRSENEEAIGVGPRTRLWQARSKEAEDIFKALGVRYIKKPKRRYILYLDERTWRTKLGKIDMQAQLALMFDKVIPYFIARCWRSAYKDRLILAQVPNGGPRRKLNYYDFEGPKACVCGACRQVRLINDRIKELDIYKKKCYTTYDERNKETYMLSLPE